MKGYDIHSNGYPSFVCVLTTHSRSQSDVDAPVQIEYVLLSSLRISFTCLSFNK